ncbi:MAG: hypothetical protein AAF988_07105, partial [Pseudomonadota bacterium]
MLLNFFNRNINDKQEQNPYHNIMPILGITLFFSYWFARYSYDNDFEEIFELFTLDFLNYSFLKSFVWADIVSLIFLGFLLIPFKDSSTQKWGFLVFLSFLLFFLKEGLDFPHLANHGIMMAFLCVGYFIIFFSHFFNGRLRDIFTNMDYMGLMRMSLIVMYFFGTFHKINSDFLHDEGCWRVFYDTIPLMPEFMLKTEIALPLGGYGTLVLEAAAMVMLFFPKTKYYGMLLGMSFHFIIGIAGTGTVAHFSAFSFALHMSFLSTDSVSLFMKSKFWLFLNKANRGKTYLRLIFAFYIL